MRLIETISAQKRANCAQTRSERRNPQQLDAVLGAVANVARHDHLVIVISDFDGHTPRTRELLLRLARAQRRVSPLRLRSVPARPAEVRRPRRQRRRAAGRASPGARDKVRRSIAEFADSRGDEILGWQREIGVPVLPLSAAEETAPQTPPPARPGSPRGSGGAEMADSRPRAGPADRAQRCSSSPTSGAATRLVGAADLGMGGAAGAAAAAVLRLARRSRTGATGPIATAARRWPNSTGSRRGSSATWHAQRGSSLALPPLLKRVALAAWPRQPMVASLRASEWVAFLRSSMADAAVPDGSAERLLDDLNISSPDRRSEASPSAQAVAERGTALDRGPSCISLTIPGCSCCCRCRSWSGGCCRPIARDGVGHGCRSSARWRKPSGMMPTAGAVIPQRQLAAEAAGAGLLGARRRCAGPAAIRRAADREDRAAARPDAGARSVPIDGHARLSRRHRQDRSPASRRCARSSPISCACARGPHRR